jgi:hypothetical protein
MKLTELTQQEKLYRLQFISELNLPITVVNDEVFFSQLEVLENTHKAKTLWELYKSEFKNSEEVVSSFRKVDVCIGEFVKSQPNWNYFNEDLDLDFLEKYVSKVKQENKLLKNIFSGNNLGKKMVSFDLSKANFNVLKHFELTGNFSNYNDFVMNFTNKEFLTHSKKFRQSVFGKLNAKRQVKYQEYVMCFLLSLFSEETRNGALLNNDEVVIDYKYINEVENVLSKFSVTFDFPLSVEVFTLNELKDKNDKLYFSKDFENGNFELKTVPKTFYVQALRKRLGFEVKEEDLFFYTSDKELAKYLEPKF